MKNMDQAGIELATPGSAVRHASVARHVTDWAMRPGKSYVGMLMKHVIEMHNIATVT